MLKSLELTGFKSFADRTRFDFGSGLTAIVGPNGSGKSNVVDALKWILGEQSAKSLRGKEMADVIFNGSGSRRSMGMAEVALTIDNSRRFLPSEADEIVVGRRLYRSGESEYLIDGQTARLKDVRELFLGTGAGAGAYSIIEQGKVDQMLQSSAKERRFIFEEAAGTSRFKTRKLEAVRRLERIEANLLRVQDIHDEVTKQLRQLQSQATKAQRHRELAGQLRELQLELALADYHRLTGAVAAVENGQPQRLERLGVLDAQLAADRDRLAAVETDLAARDEQSRRLLAEVAQIRSEASARDSDTLARSGRLHEYDEQLAAVLRRLVVARRAARHARQRRREAATSLAADRVAAESLRGGLAEQEQAVAQATATLDALRARLAEVQSRRDGVVAELSRLENEQAALEGQSDLLHQQRARLRTRHRRLVTRLDRERRRRAEVRTSERLLRGQQGRTRHQQGDLRDRLDDRLRLRRSQAALAAESRQDLATLHSRREILEGLQQRHEGLGGGVRQVLERKAAGDPLWQDVQGVLAEQLEVPAEHAELVELALGAQAQALIVPDESALTEELVAAAHELPGRVHFLTVAPRVGERFVVFDESFALPTLAAYVGCPEPLRPLIDRLLGMTFLAEDFPSALAIDNEAGDIRLVTAAGEVLHPDGSVGAGPAHGTAGILSRRAELRTLAGEIADGQRTAAEHSAAQQRIDADIARLEAVLDAQTVRETTLADQYRHFESVGARADQRIAGLADELRAVQADQTEAVAEADAAVRAAEENERALQSRYAAMKSLTEQRDRLVGELDREDESSSAARQRIAETRSQVAVQEERLAAAAGQGDDLVRQVEERDAEVRSQSAELGRLRSQRAQTALSLLAARAERAAIAARLDAVAGSGGDDLRLAASLRDERAALAERVERHRSEADALRGESHQVQLTGAQDRAHLQTLVQRTRDDFGLELAEELGDDYEPPDPQLCEQARTQVRKLRDEVAALGSVNAAAIEELDDMQQRAGSLGFQIEDLRSARKQLEGVIGRINDESRRMFLETFEAVRVHFQQFYRRLFGGGKADILLEDEADPLESGIEIVARPPGKEPRSISLLSGGEKTMTAVALLMALFRSRPTPYCVLDEVDAALDEANIGRFMNSLRDFIADTQFVIITHSKTTMANADVLHGVTQRESGISIRVSVNLEEVAEDGTIEAQAVA